MQYTGPITSWTRDYTSQIVILIISICSLLINLEMYWSIKKSGGNSHHTLLGEIWKDYASFFFGCLIPVIVLISFYMTRTPLTQFEKLQTPVYAITIAATLFTSFAIHNMESNTRKK
jgi:uncharacterized membrane protein